MMNFRHSITFRFTIWYLGILTILLVSLGTGVYLTLSLTLYGNLDAALQARVTQLSEFREILSIIAGGTFEDEAGEYISFYFYNENKLRRISPRGKDFPVRHEIVDKVLAGESLFADIEIPNGGVFRVFISPFIPDNPEVRPERFVPEKQGQDEFDRTDHRPPHPPPRRDDIRPPPPPQNKRVLEIHKAALVVARPTGDISRVLQQLLQIMSGALPLTLLLSGGGGVFLARRALKPVEQIADCARQIGETDLGRRIPVQTRDELGYLAETLNQMIARLERAFERQKEFTGDASHELRGPLSVIQAEATLALGKERSPNEYRKTLETIAGEAEHMAHLTGQLLELARADSGKETYAFERLDLNELARAVGSDMEVLCREKGLELQLQLGGPVLVRGDKKSLRRLIVNLLSNAFRYTDSGGMIRIKVKAGFREVSVIVSDTGMGIPEEHLPFIFQRFYRVDKARSRDLGGSGLGLAICKHIAQIHKGVITVESQVGKGSVFHFRMPVNGGRLSEAA